MTKNAMIEVYEWKKGEARPRSNNKAPAIELLAVPDLAQVPQVGDVLHIYTGEDPSRFFGLVQFVVIERELLWGPRANDDPDAQTPLAWSKMWIHVRRLADYEQPASTAI